MSTAAARLATRMVINHVATRSIDFRFEGFALNGSMYDKILAATENGSVKFLIDDEALREGGAEAIYRMRVNTFVFGSEIYRSTTLTTKFRVSVIHECTHCVNDIHRIPITQKHDEALAWIAERIYLLKLTGLPPPRPDSPSTDLARKILAKPGLDITKEPAMKTLIDRILVVYRKSFHDDKWGARILSDG